MAGAGAGAGAGQKQTRATAKGSKKGQSPKRQTWRCVPCGHVGV